MLSRLFACFFLSFLLLLGACSGSDEGKKSSSSEQNQEIYTPTLVPLSDDLADALCSLTRRSSEHQLVEIFGQPTERKETGDMVMLRWQTTQWSADAMFSSGQLKLAAANAKQPQKTKGNLLKDHPDWGPDTRLEEMESVLGPGVRVGVQWHSGVEVAASIRRKPDFDSTITRDRCSDRYAWTNLDMGGFSSLRFFNGTLQGAL